MTQQIKSHQLDIDEELLLNANPSSNLGAATKQYVDSIAGSVGQVSPVSSTGSYVTYDNGMIVYKLNVSLTGSQTKVVALPIANNHADILGYYAGGSSDSNWVLFSSMTTTTITLTNATIIAASASLIVLAL